jgi:protoheme ferro-lyase
MKVLKWVLILLIIIAAAGYGLYTYKNQPLKPDYFEVYKKQDTTPAGKVGVFVTTLIMPEELSYPFFYNVTFKIFNTIVPWPFRNFVQKDSGVALLDPVKYHEHHEFQPTKLVDPFGNDRDLDGTPYVEKYKQGKMKWIPPSKMIYLDHGYFLYTGRQGGMPSIAGKVMNKARIWYYGKGLGSTKLPHWQQTFAVIDGAMGRIKKKYPDVQWQAETSMLYADMRHKLHELLDAGCDTIVLSSPLAMYSHFEDFNSGFRHSIEYIEEWEHEHPGKKIKVIMAPPMGNFKPMRDAYLQMLKDRLDSLPKNASVMVAVTVHGMPWEKFKWEAWLELAPAYRDKLFEEVKQMVASYKFPKTNVVQCQDEFADPIWDPQQKYLSTNRAYWSAIKEGYDYAIGLPIEFYAENSDTMFHHALKNYKDFDQYDVYKQIDYKDWSQPYVREMVQGKTRVIYNGVPVGKYQKYVIDALYQSLDTILSKQAGK